MKRTIRLLVADDHQVVRAGLVSLLEQQHDFTIVGQAGTGDKAARLSAELKPDVVLMDLQMPNMDGVKATEIIKSLLPDTEVLVLTTFDDDELIWGAIRAGAKGYLLKDAPPADLFRAIRQVAAGETLISQEILARLTEVIRQGGPNPTEHEEQLTEREREILHLIAQGLSNKEIAATLSISDNTVKTHISNLFEKLRVNDRTQAVTTALRLGLITLD